MKRSIILFALTIFAVTTANAKKCEELFAGGALKTGLGKIHVDTESDYNNVLNKKTLEFFLEGLQEIRDFTAMYFTWPEKLDIYFEPSGVYSFAASTGRIEVRIRDGSNSSPLYSEKKLTPQMVKAIFLHESVHALFFQKLNEVFSEYRPTYKTKLKNGGEGEWHPVETISIPYQEFVADLIAAVMMNDPKVMEDALGYLKVGSKKLRSFKRDIPLKGWSQIAIEDMAIASGKEFAVTEHLLFAPIRSVVWRKYIEPSFKKKNTAQVLKAVVDAAIQEVAWYQDKIDPNHINSREFYHLDLEEMNTRFLSAIEKNLKP